MFQEQFPNTNPLRGRRDSGRRGALEESLHGGPEPIRPAAYGREEVGEGPVVTVASEAIAVPDSAHNRIQLSMIDASSHQAGKDPNEYFNSRFSARGSGAGGAAARRAARARPFRETDRLPLLRLAKTSVDARIELHQRLALPPACLLLALVGIPLGVSTRKAGKSAALVTTVFLAFLYYTGTDQPDRSGQAGHPAGGAAVWTPNAGAGRGGPRPAGEAGTARGPRPGRRVSRVVRRTTTGGCGRSRCQALPARRSGSRAGCYRCCRRSSTPTSCPRSCCTSRCSW